MNSSLQPSQVPILTAAPSACTPPVRRPRQTTAFQFGKKICPERDQIGGYLWEERREQLCIPKDWLMRIEQLAGPPRFAWQGRWVHRPVQSRILLRVVSTKFGWRVQQGLSWWRPLTVMGKLPLVFPTAASGIAAAELFYISAPGEFWYLSYFEP